MDVMLQRHCARYIYVVPDGLRELINDISREVLRSQPEDIYTFIADYLDALMITRENARIAAKLVQYLTDAAETIVDLLHKTGMTREEADKKFEVIQRAFKSWNSRKGILKEDDNTVITRIISEAGISSEQAEQAAIVIQNAFRAFKLKQQREKQLLSGIIDWRVAARSAIRLYRKTGVSPEEAKRAATLIKAAYKGYYTRRNILNLKKTVAAEEEEQKQTEEEQVEEDEADTYSMISSISTDRKSKGVRIDFATVVPHVDFGEEIVIQHKPVQEVESVGPMQKFLEPENVELGQQSSQEYIRNLLEECIISSPIFRTDQDDQSENEFDHDAPISSETQEAQQQVSGENKEIKDVEAAKTPHAEEEPTTDVVTPISTEVNEQTAAVDEQTAAVDEQKAAVDEQKAAVDEQTAAVDEQKAAVDEQTAAVDEQKAAVDEQKAAVDEQKAAVDEQTAAVDEQKAAVDEQKAAVDEQKAAVDEQTAAVDEQTAAVNEQTAAVDEQTAAVNEQTAAVNETTTEVNETTTPVSEPTTPVSEPTTPVSEPTTEVTDPTSQTTESTTAE